MKTPREQLREKAAEMLDRTNFDRFDSRGPRSNLARSVLAKFLDGVGFSTFGDVRRAIAWLERVLLEEKRRDEDAEDAAMRMEATQS